jgi:tetratricopeptide (TPR) repeat protein
MKMKKCRVLPFLTAIGLLLLLSGCVAFQVGGDIQKGRMALMYGDPNVALEHFQRAADSNPNYLLDFSIFDEGVWTYVGRAYYAMGKLPEAQKAFERARSRHNQDHLAKLYLGMVLGQDGNRPRGLREIEAGLRGLGDWLDDLERNLSDGVYWDPGLHLRKEIQRSLAMIESRDVNWSQLIASGEWLGREFEEEIDESEKQFLDDLGDGDGDGRG